MADKKTKATRVVPAKVATRRLPPLPRVKPLTRVQMRRTFDERCEQLLAMTGDEFLKRAKLGTLPDVAAVTHLKIIAGIE